MLKFDSELFETYNNNPYGIKYVKITFLVSKSFGKLTSLHF
jgi:hypothetical protein